MSGGDRRTLYVQWIADLVSVVSQDVGWRARLFNAPPRGTFDVTADDFERASPLAQAIRDNGLKFEVFHDGLTKDGATVFGFRSLEFPDVERYSTNWRQPGVYDL